MAKKKIVKKIIPKTKKPKRLKKVRVHRDEKGTCLYFSDDDEMINKTKYRTSELCQARINVLLKLGVTPVGTIPYICMVCKSWHIGRPGQPEKYGK